MKEVAAWEMKHYVGKDLVLTLDGEFYTSGTLTGVKLEADHRSLHESNGPEVVLSFHHYSRELKRNPHFSTMSLMKMEEVVTVVSINGIEV